MSVAPAAENGTITLSEEGLRRLLDDVAKGQGFLPPGAYRDEQGQVWRDVLEPTGRVRRNKITGGMESVNRKVRRPVFLTNDTSRAGLIAARDQAVRRGMDFYWPGQAQGVAVGCPEPGSTAAIGWLRYGLKRESDVPVNQGSGAEMFEMVATPIDDTEDIGSPSATMQGVERVPDDMQTSSEPEPVASGLSGFTDEALGDIPMSSRSRKGN